MPRATSIRAAVIARHLQQSSCAGTWSIKGVEYKLLDRGTDPEKLFQFNKTYGTGFAATLKFCLTVVAGSTPHNFIPDAPVREHFAKVATGETLVRFTTVPPQRRVNRASTYRSGVRSQARS